jgi:hypothetical protein
LGKRYPEAFWTTLTGKMRQTSHEWVQDMKCSFTGTALIEKMRKAEYQFFDHPDISFV